MKTDKIYPYGVLKWCFAAAVFVVGFFGLAKNAFAADVHVRATIANDATYGCTNNGDGTSWACASTSGGVGALTTLPNLTTWGRGNTYYFARGTYGDVATTTTISTATSGTATINIYRATSDAHGTDTGWSAALATGQAIWQGKDGLSSRFSIRASYVNFDGIVGSGDDPSTYGFYFPSPDSYCDNATQTQTMLGIPQTGYSGTLNISNALIAHTAFITCGYDYQAQGSQDPIFSNPLSGSYMTIRNNYFSQGSTNIGFFRWSHGIIKDNYFESNWSNSATAHGQQISGDGTTDITVSGNIFRNSAIFVIGNHANTGSGNRRWNVYNNIVTGENDCATCSMTGGFTAVSGLPDTQLESYFHHNTFYNINLGGRGPVFVANITSLADKSYAYNNLFYNVTNGRMDNPGYTSGAIVHDYNAYISSTGYTTEDHMTTGSSDPFINSSGENFHLTAHTDAGTALSSPFNVDYDGITRAAFDRGAYEYVSGDTTPPVAPSGLSVS